jgi:hypothetical protein
MRTSIGASTGLAHISRKTQRSIPDLYARYMRRVIVTTVLAATALLGLSSCAQPDIPSANVDQADLYKVGCPAVDAAAGGGSAVSKVTVAGLKKLSESGRLDPEPQRWVDATISLLESDDPKNPPSDVKKLIIDGCAKNGYPLQNLK